MAGLGKRFKDKGYTLPKHQMRIKNRTMFEWAMESLRNFFNEQFIFIAREEANDHEFISEKCDCLGIHKKRIKLIHKLTAGQATTALEAKPYLNPNKPIIIYNIDTYVEPTQLIKKMIRGHGWVPIFEAKGTHWSFVKFDHKKKISNITEKKRISPYGSIGLYYFSSFSLFEYAYKHYYKNNTQEHYVAPLYTILINENKEIFTTVIDNKKVHVLGTPKEVKDFEES